MGRAQYQDAVLKTAGTSNSAYSSDFGKAFLTKFGWSEGDGIGKDNQGVTAPVQVRRREDNLGIGAEKQKAKDWDCWWENLYNDHANKVVAVSKKKVKKTRIIELSGPELLALCRRRRS